MKYRPAYAVMFNNQIIGYVKDENNFKKLVEDRILKTEDENIAFVSLDKIDYTFEFVTRNLIKEDQTFSTLKESAKNIYRIYEITNGKEENNIYVNTLKEAENIVDELKEEYDAIDTNLTINTLYLENEISDEAIKIAKAKMNKTLSEEQEKQEEINSRTINGIYLACLPVSGNISSRFGSRESIRNHVHMGLDIAAGYGTDIKAVAEGEVTYSGWCGGYGNLVTIDHGNGITTKYGHCSKIYVSVGQKVSAEDVIAAVGSTGNSTGNHLHFEVLVDGTQVNPQNYLYK